VEGRQIVQPDERSKKAEGRTGKRNRPAEPGKRKRSTTHQATEHTIVGRWSSWPRRRCWGPRDRIVDNMARRVTEDETGGIWLRHHQQENTTA
jgi:hypothetical protein